MAGKLDKVRDWLMTVLYLDVQVILVHDKQDVLTGDEIENLVNQYSSDRIEFTESNFGNPGAARNAGLEIAAGDWICFWDSDDCPKVDKFMEMVALGEKFNSNIVVGEYEIKDERMKSCSVGQEFTGQPLIDFSRVAFNPGIWRMIFRRSFVEGVKFPSLRMGEDQLFLARLQPKLSHISFCDEKVYTYYTGIPSQLTSNRDAIKDLAQVSIECLGIFRIRENIEREFLSIMLCRQLITLFKRGNLIVRVRSIWLSLQFLLLTIRGKAKAHSATYFVFHEILKMRGSIQ
jgi:cellulose synthase/poly-beta-1,6-N-acetylglucosamine synthase-like glycosyltransferase